MKVIVGFGLLWLLIRSCVFGILTNVFLGILVLVVVDT